MTKKEIPYDSTNDIKKHANKVRVLLIHVNDALLERAENHDESKFWPKEKQIFDKYKPLLDSEELNSEAYFLMIEKMKPAIEHHWKFNDHHPEHFPANGVADMNLIQLIEMACDWIAAADDRGNDPVASFNKSCDRFGVDIQLRSILLNTAALLSPRLKK